MRRQADAGDDPESEEESENLAAATPARTLGTSMVRASGQRTDDMSSNVNVP